MRCVWPAIRAKCGGGDIIPIETVTDSGLAHRFDMLSGIDAWQVQENAGIRGIASRVQWGRDWGTFTIRYSRASGARTEWDKIRDHNPDDGYIRPHLVVQGYCTKPGGSLIAAYVLRARDLYALATDEHEGTAWFKRRVGDGNVMAVFEVQKLREKGVEVYEARPDT